MEEGRKVKTMISTEGREKTKGGAGVRQPDFMLEQDGIDAV